MGGRSRQDYPVQMTNFARHARICMKRQAILSVILLLIVGFSTVYFFQFHLKSGSNYSLKDAIPAETIFSLKIGAGGRSFEELEMNPITGLLFGDSVVSASMGEIFQTDSLLKARRLKANLCFARESSTGLNWLLLVEIKGAGKLEKLLAYGELHLSEEHESLQKAENNFYYRKGNLVGISPSESLLESSFTLLNSLEEESDDALAVEQDLVLHFEFFDWWLSTLINPEQSELTDLFKNFSGHGEFEIKGTDNQLNLYGSLDIERKFIPAKSRNFGPARAFSAASLIPQRTAYLQVWLNELWDSRIEAGEQDSLIVKKIDSLQKSGLDFGQLTSLVGNDLGYGLLQPYDTDLGNDEFAFVNVQDSSGLASLLLDTNLTSDTLSVSGHLCGRLHSSAFAELFFGFREGAFRSPWYAIVKGHLFLVNERAILLTIIEEVESGKTMAADLEYARAEEASTAQCNQLVYVQPSRLTQYIEIVSSQKSLSFLKRNPNFLDAIDYFKLQITESDEKPFCHIGIFYREQELVEREPSWRQLFDRELKDGPFPVKNYLNGENELLISNQTNELILLDKAGEKRWSYQMDYPIVGKVHQIDAYSNGKLQYLFSTRAKIHLVDRKGRAVSGFPVKLSDNVAVPMSCLDPRGDKDYLLMVGTQNNAIYAFDRRGRPVSGWTPRRIDSPLSSPVQYFIKDGKTYFFASSRKGKLYVWDRNGRTVFEPIEIGTRLLNPMRMYFAQELEKCRLVSSDSTAKLIFTRLNGEIEKRQFGTWGPDHQLLIEDFDRDGSKEYLFADQERVVIYRESGGIMFQHVPGAKITGEVKVARIEGEYALFIPVGKEIQAYQLNGEKLESSPFDNCSANFTISDLSITDGPDLISISNNKELITYKIIP